MKEASAGDEVSVFTEASRLPVGERAAFLDRACAGDADLRRRVESLLKAHSEAGDFLEDAPWASAAGDGGPPPVGEKPGDRIGRYRLLQSIGEGGCGVVFLAEQEEPVRRRVALKIIKPGMDTRSVIARFEAERQALALMDHPNIAKVLDAGATASGRPYFVMDWIRGLRITEHCDRARLTLCERLHLFVAVCQAVQHAHQKGILHRDLKPSNILVATREDGSAVPMVIDFGIAKATGGQRLTDKTLQTELSLPMGTPAYMSPEQAALGQDDVDTRSDVYSLGVLLYELVTGTPPIDLAVAKRAGLDELRRLIREEEPVPPSTRLGSMSEGDRTAAAQARQWEPSQLIRGVRGDLDWIVMKALEKDRARRYETANGLALDVKRLLAHEAVLARPPSAAYRLGKAIRRHRVIAVSVAVVLGLVLASLVVVIAALRKEHRARLAAQTQELRSREVTGLLKNMLEGVGPAVARGRDTTLLLEILDRTAQELDRSTDGQPEVEAEMRNLLSRLYLEIGNYPKAEAMAAESVRLYRSATGSESLETAAALNGLGAASWKLRKLPEAEAAHSEALRIRRGLLGLAHPEVASSLDQLGGVYRRQRRLNEAESLTREGLQIRRAAFGAEHLEVAESLRSLSIVLTDLGRRSEAESAAREMLAMRRRLLGEDHPSVASALSDLAWILGRDSEESEQLESEAFEIQREVLGGKHPDLVKSIYAMGERMRQRGRLTESHTVLRAALSIQRRLLGEDHPDVLATLTGLGATLEQEGRWNEAAATYREALAVRRRQPAGARAAASGVAEGEALVRVLMAHGELDQAERALAEFLGTDTAGQGATPALLKWRADLRGRQARWREAAVDAAALVNLQPAEHYHYHMLAPLLLVLGDRAGFEQVCRRMVAAFADTENAYVAERVAKNGLLVPSIGLDASALDSLATRSLGPPGWSTPMPYSEVVKALSEVRMGRAAEGIRRAQQLSGSGEIHARSAAQAVLALGHAVLGQTADAQHALREGQRLSREVMPGRDAATIGAGWLPWLSAALLLEEARQKVGGDEDPPGPEAPPLK